MLEEEENKLYFPPPPTAWQLDGALLGSGEPRTARAKPSIYKNRNSLKTGSYGPEK